MKSILVLILTVILILAPVTALADRQPDYELHLDTVPPLGRSGPICGTIFSLETECVESAYVVKLFLRMSEGEPWYPKPTYEKPYVTPEFSGFILDFATGENDINARTLSLMLMRPEYASLTDYYDAEARALYIVNIERYPNGTFDITTSLRSDSAAPVGHTVDIGFYTDNGAQPGSALTENQLRRTLSAAAAVADRVRFYGASGALAPAYELAAEYSLRVIGTAWLDGSENDKAELDALIAHCNAGMAEIAVVGNETQHAGTLPLQTLLEDMEYVRSRLTDPTIPVTTSETPDVLLTSESLRSACDILAVNAYPYWNGTPIDLAAEDLEATLTALQAYGLPVLLSETGWPTAGSSAADAESAERYLNDATSVCERLDIPLCWFALADEPWKEAYEGSVGSHWGLLNSDLTFKEDRWGTTAIPAPWLYISLNTDSPASSVE